MYTIIYIAILGWISIKYSILFGVTSLREALESAISVLIVLSIIVSNIVWSDADCKMTISANAVFILLSALPPITGQRKIYGPLTVFVFAARLAKNGCTTLAIISGVTQLVWIALYLA